MPLKPESQELQKNLNNFLKNHQKIVILGIGNELRGDDYAGSLAAHRLSQIINREDMVILNGETVPENFTGLIRKEIPSHILLIDAADMGEPPGHIKLINQEEIIKYHISTHAMPLSFLMKYLKQTTDASIILIGIQPSEMEMGNIISDEVKNSVDFLVDILNSL